MEARGAIPVNEQEVGDLYVVGKKASGGNPEESPTYVGYASLPLRKNDSGEWEVNRDGDCESVPFHVDVKNAYVTWFRADQRRDVLSLFARHPKSFERCELVSLKALRADRYRISRYVQMVGRGIRTAPAQEGGSPSRLDAKTRCLMVTTLTQSTLSDLTELESIERHASGGNTELGSLISQELERRRKLSKEALERIWQEPLGHISYEPLDTCASSSDLYRVTAPQPGDE